MSGRSEIKSTSGTLAPEWAAINIISNTFHDFKDNAIANANHCSFNPIDKVVELYEALVKSEREKNDLLQRMLDERK